jgi:protein O-GlcNAc transferase
MNFNFHGKEVSLELHPAGQDLISDIIRDRKTFFEEALLVHTAKRHPYHGTIIDVGANIGNHTVFYAEFLSAEKIVAYEPVALNYRVLLVNTRKHINVVCHHQAVGPQKGAVAMKPMMQGNMGMYGVVAPNTSGTLNVDMVRLDDQNHTDVTMIKIDVEGFELGVLMGATHTIRRWKPVLFIELLTIQQLYEVVNFLRPLGYALVAMPDKADPTAEFVYVGKA